MTLNRRMKKKLKNFVPEISVNPRLYFWNRGRDLNLDIALTCPKSEVHVVFDVGAHIGEETRNFLKNWPDAKVYSFEPSPETFQILQRKCHHSRVLASQLAMSSDLGDASFVAAGTGSSNRLDLNGLATENRITVKRSTIDVFCSEQNVSTLDILKIDTEGHELHVLKGAEGKLKNSEIGFIRAECGVDFANDRHVSYSEIVSMLSEFGYRVFGVYEQENEFFRKEPQLRRFDMAFISPKEIEKNAGLAQRRPRTWLDAFVSIKRRLVGRR